MTKDNRHTIDDEQYVLLRRNDNHHDIATTGYTVTPIATNFNKDVLEEIRRDIIQREYGAGDFRHSYKILRENTVTRFQNLFQK